MNYLIVFDIHTPTGRALSVSPDHWFNDGQERLPAIRAEKIDISQGYYLCATILRKDQTRREWKYPHHSVVLIVEYGDDAQAPPPFGFSVAPDPSPKKLDRPGRAVMD